MTRPVQWKRISTKSLRGKKKEKNDEPLHLREGEGGQYKDVEGGKRESCL
jgi:hypothetical protein